MLHILALLLSVLFVPTSVGIAPPAYSPPPETCNAIHSLVGGELVEWIGYPQGWNLPADLEVARGIDFESGGIVLYYSKSERARYLYVFTSYEATADANGEHLGSHEFCGPYRISDDA